jgi:hypothetical protein
VGAEAESEEEYVELLEVARAAPPDEILFSFESLFDFFGPIQDFLFVGKNEKRKKFLFFFSQSLWAKTLTSAGSATISNGSNDIFAKLLEENKRMYSRIEKGIEDSASAVSTLRTSVTGVQTSVSSIQESVSNIENSMALKESVNDIHDSAKKIEENLKNFEPFLLVCSGLVSFYKWLKSLLESLSEDFILCLVIILLISCAIYFFLFCEGDLFFPFSR